MKEAPELEKLIWYYLHRREIKDFEEVVFEAVSTYLHQVLDRIPQRFWDEVEVFLTQEAWDILKQFTYGSESLQEFHQRRIKQ